LDICFKVGDHVTSGINGDCYPEMVVKATKSGKTVWVRSVPYTVVGRLDDGSWVSTSDDFSVDDFDQESEIEFGTQIRIKFHPDQVDLTDLDEYPGSRFRYSNVRQRYDQGGYNVLTPGLRYRRNPHV